MPGKPVNVRAKLEEDNINVFWEEPVNPNGIITEYNVSGNSLLCLHVLLSIFVTQSPRNTSFVTLSEWSIGKACFH